MPRYPARSCRRGLLRSVTLAMCLVAVSLTAVVAARANSDDVPVHVALVLDGSGSMAGDRLASMQEGASGLVGALSLSDHASRRVAVTEYRSTPNRLCDLTNDHGEAIACLDQVHAAGGTRLDLGILDGLSALRDGRDGTALAPRESLVALTDGGHASGCQPVIDAAEQAKSEGVAVYTICLGTDCDPACLEPAASSREHFHLTMQHELLPDVFDAIAAHILGATATSTPASPSATPSATATPLPTPTLTPSSSPTPTVTSLPTIAPTQSTPTAQATHDATSSATWTPSSSVIVYLPAASRSTMP